MSSPKKDLITSKISIIVPFFDTKELIDKLFPALITAKKYKKNQILEIIVIDDASTDGSYQKIKKNYPSIRLIRHKKNRGFSASINTGVRSAKGSLLALVNSDVFPQKKFLEHALKHFRKDKVFAVSLNEKGFAWARASFENGFVELKQGRSKDKSHETFWVNGGSGLFRRDYWMKLGGLDEKLFGPFYWEDIDICYRAAKRGFINVWEPNANVFHRHESTIKKLVKKRTDIIRERNQLFFIWKNITSSNLTRKHILGLFQRVVKHPGYLKIVLIALRKVSIVLRARKKEKREGKISDEAIFAKFS